MMKTTGPPLIIFRNTMCYANQRPRQGSIERNFGPSGLGAEELAKLTSQYKCPVRSLRPPPPALIPQFPLLLRSVKQPCLSCRTTENQVSGSRASYARS